MINMISFINVQVGNDEEMAQSERNSHSVNYFCFNRIILSKLQNFTILFLQVTCDFFSDVQVKAFHNSYRNKTKCKFQNNLMLS